MNYLPAVLHFVPNLYNPKSTNPTSTKPVQTNEHQPLIFQNHGKDSWSNDTPALYKQGYGGPLITLPKDAAPTQSAIDRRLRLVHLDNMTPSHAVV